MAQEMDALLTGLSSSLNQYLGMDIQMQMQDAQDTKKFNREMEGRKQLSEYESQLSMSRDLMKIALEEEAKGKDYTEGTVVSEMTGNPVFAKMGRVANKDVF